MTTRPRYACQGVVELQWHLFLRPGVTRQLPGFTDVIGGAAGAVTGRAMVQDLFDGSQRTRVMAYVGMVMGLVPPLATVVGGQMHVRFGWQSNFTLMAVVSLAMLDGLATLIMTRRFTVPLNNVLARGSIGW